MLRRRLGVLALVLTSLVALAGPASAQRKPKKPRPACDLAYLPFTPGAQWTYTFFMTGDQPAGVYVKDPETFTVKVLELGKDGDATVIKLEESYRKRVVATELRCGTDGLVVPPASFYFFGEPGGGVQMELADLKRVGGPEWPGAKPGLKGGEELYEELKATAIRTASAGTETSLPKAAVELERKAVVGGHEDVESKLGSHDATRVDLELTGRANLDGQPKEKEFNMPGAKAVLFFVAGTGVVRVESSSGKGWQLSAFSDGSAPVPVPAPAPAPAPAP